MIEQFIRNIASAVESVELEPLSTRRELRDLAFEGVAHLPFSAGEAYRDDEYHIQIRMNGDVSREMLNSFGHRQPFGKPIDGMQIQCKDQFGGKCRISDFSRISFKANLHRESSEINGEATSFETAYDLDTEPRLISIWYGNGPTRPFMGRQLVASLSGEYVRQHSNRNDEIAGIERISVPGRSLVSSSYYIVRADPFEFQLTVLPEERTSSSFNQVRLDFYLGTENIDWCSDLSPLSDALSFVFGRRLVALGKTQFGQQFERQREQTYSPQRLPAREAKAEGPPAVWPQLAPTESEKLFGRLIAKYLSKRNVFGFDRCLPKVWSSLLMPIDYRLVILYMGLEAMMEQWNAAEEGHSVNKPIASFDTVRDTLGKAMVQSDIPVDDRDRVLRSLDNLNRPTLADRLRQFFVDIQLPVSPLEDSLLLIRNKLAHGSQLKTNQYMTVIEADRALRTLINRVMLRLIDYDGQYVDYSTMDFPSRPLDEPSKGFDGKGKPLKLS